MIRRNRSARRTREDIVVDVVNYALLTIVGIVMLYPFYYTIICSFSDGIDLMKGGVYLFPRVWSLASYKLFLSDASWQSAFFVSVARTLVGTVLCTLLTTVFAYGLSRRELLFRKSYTMMVIITMYFSGGLIPYYVTIMQLGMINTFWVMVIPGAISAYNVIVFKTFFMSIPEALRESASLDGAGHVRILFQIVLPLSKAVLATFALFSIVGYWNDYMTALLYLRDDTKYPIQLLMRRLLVLMDYKDASTAQMLKDFQKISTRTTKAAATIITVVPVLCVYPFMQKHFAKGVLVGSIKA